MADTPSIHPINLVRTGPRGRTPVVFVHAVGLDLTYWGPQIDALWDDDDVALEQADAVNAHPAAFLASRWRPDGAGKPRYRAHPASEPRA